MFRTPEEAWRGRAREMLSLIGVNPPHARLRTHAGHRQGGKNSPLERAGPVLRRPRSHASTGEAPVIVVDPAGYRTAEVKEGIHEPQRHEAGKSND